MPRLSSTELSRQTKLYLTPEGHKVLEEHAALSGVSMSRTVETLIEEVLEPELEDLRGAPRDKG